MRPADVCDCEKPSHDGRLVVLTGGPGAGKTATLEVIRRDFCQHVAVLPESASILFSGGFPRRPSLVARRAAQRAICQVQRQLERAELEERQAAVVLCDRGTIDSLAYWDGPPELFWAEVGSSLDVELARYSAVIHLRTPAADGGYNRRNPLRTETPQQAAAIDERILAAWSRHPRRFVVDNAEDFMVKLATAVELVRAEVPACCRSHPLRAR